MTPLARRAALLLVCVLGVARAHDVRPAYLDLREVEPDRFEVLWRTPVVNGVGIAVHLVLPGTCRTLATSVERDADAEVEHRTIAVSGGSAGMHGERIEFSGLERTITDVFVRVSDLRGGVVTALVRPARPWVVVPALESPLTVCLAYVGYGFQHIMLGLDHLLFVFGLLLLVRGARMLVKTITAFTIAHSLTLIVATLGWAHAPAAPLNLTIALSILFLAIEVAGTWRGRASLSAQRPWLVALCFGLLHGFGFASGLSLAGMPRGQLVAALLCFNVGVELGQLLFVLAVLAVAWAFRTLECAWPWWARRVPGYGIGVAGAYWTLQRLMMLGAG